MMNPVIPASAGMTVLELCFTKIFTFHAKEMLIKSRFVIPAQAGIQENRKRSINDAID
jgi:hypothetical protein